MIECLVHPGTSSFVGEFLILVGSFKVNTTITFLGATSVIMGGVYSLWLLNRIAFGNLKIQYTNKFLDLSQREFIIIVPLILVTCDKKENKTKHLKKYHFI